MKSQVLQLPAEAGRRGWIEGVSALSGYSNARQEWEGRNVLLGNWRRL